MSLEWGRTPLVSIIINNYNYERFLDQAIVSALTQTYPHTEVVVVDDGSTDGSQARIAGYDGCIVPVLKENGGQASAFNSGFAASRGEIVIFLDADDYLFPHATERVVSAWSEGVAAIQYRLRTVDALGRQIGFRPPRDAPMDSGDVLRTLLDKGYYRFPPTSGNGLSRTALEQLMPIPEADWRLSADGYLATLLPFQGKIACVEEPLGAYRVHGANLWMRRDTKDTARLASRVRHDLQKYDLLVSRASQLRYQLPDDLALRNHRALQYRLSSLRLNPQGHPVPADGRLTLTYHGARAVWRYSGLSTSRRMILGAWFIVAGLAPLRVARPVFSWGLNPDSRPQFVNWVRDLLVMRKSGLPR